MKKITNIERVLISECVKDEPSFVKIQKLFDMGANPNAVNEYGECVLAIAMEGYCNVHGANLRSGFFAPIIVDMFIENGFSVRRHGLYVISELQNGVYDKYMRRAIKTILKRRSDDFRNDLKQAGELVKIIAHNMTAPKSKVKTAK